jgi:signal peptidase II
LSATSAGPVADAEVDGPPTTPPRAIGLRVMLPVALAVVVLDQLTKWWALERLDTGNIDVFWTLRFNLVFNSGSAFSLGRGLGPLLGVVAVVVVVLLVRFGRMVSNLPTAIALGLVLGGAVGNLADRLFRSDGEGFLGGHVVDFIDFQWWPVFNVADIGIVVGGLLLVLVAMRMPPNGEPG